jgi:hypothetical protein
LKLLEGNETLATWQSLHLIQEFYTYFLRRVVIGKVGQSPSLKWEHGLFYCMIGKAGQSPSLK